MHDACFITGAHESLSLHLNSLWVSFCTQQYKCNVNIQSVVSRNAVMFVSVCKKLKKIPLTKLGQVANESW